MVTANMRLRPGFTVVIAHHHHHHHHRNHSIDSSNAESSVCSDLSDDDDDEPQHDVVDPLLLGLSPQYQRRCAAARELVTTTAHRRRRVVAVSAGPKEMRNPMDSVVVDCSNSISNSHDPRTNRTQETAPHDAVDKCDPSTNINCETNAHMIVSVPLDDLCHDQGGDSLLKVQKLSSLLLEGMDGNSTLGTSITSAVSSLHRNNSWPQQQPLSMLFQPIHRRSHMHRRGSCSTLPSMDLVYETEDHEDNCFPVDAAIRTEEHCSHHLMSPPSPIPHLLQFSSSLRDPQPAKSRASPEVEVAAAAGRVPCAATTTSSKMDSNFPSPARDYLIF